jgi:hypothetical protein
VVQSDFVGSTALASARRPEEVVEVISELFGIFDELADTYEVWKVETVGDAYIAAQAEKPLTEKNRVLSVLKFAREMIRQTEAWSTRAGESVRCRVGVNRGKCIGGIVGTEMQRYHLFGELMDSLDALESTAPEGRVHLSRSCKEQADIELGEETTDLDAIVDICAQDVEPEFSFCARSEAQLITSKGEIVNFSKVGGAPTYLLTENSGTGGKKQPAGVRFLPAATRFLTL